MSSNNLTKIRLYIELSPTDQSNSVLHTKTFELNGKKSKQTTFNDILLQLQDDLQMIFPQNSCFVMTTTSNISSEMVVGLSDDTSDMSSVSNDASSSKHDRMKSFGANLVGMVYGGGKKRKSIPGSFYYDKQDISEGLVSKNTSHQSTTSNDSDEMNDGEMKREFIKMKSTVFSMKEYAHSYHLISADNQPPTIDTLYLELFPNCAPFKAKVFGNYLQTICKNETLFNFHFLMKSLKTYNTLNSNWIISEIESRKKTPFTTLLSPLTVLSPQTLSLCANNVDLKNIDTLYASLTDEERLHVKEPTLYLLRDVKIPFVLRACFHFLKSNDPSSQTPRVANEGIFRQAGSKVKIEKFMKKFNTLLAFPTIFPNGIHFPPNTDAHLVADLIKRFLREMQDPLLSYEKYDEFIRLFEPHADVDGITQEASKDYFHVLESTKRLVHTLPQVNQAVLRELLSILRMASIGEYANDTKMTPKTMAIVMSTNLMFVPQSSVAVVLDDFKRMSIRAHLQKQQQTLPIICQVCRFLIENAEQIFPSQSSGSSSVTTPRSSNRFSINLSALGNDEFSVMSSRRSAQFTSSMMQQLNSVINKSDSSDDNTQTASSESTQPTDNALKLMEEHMKELEDDYQQQIIILSQELEELRKDISYKDELIIELKKESFNNLQKEDSVKNLTETLEIIQKEKAELEQQTNSLKSQIEEKEEHNKELSEFCERLQLNLETREKELDEKSKQLEKNSSQPTVDLKRSAEEEQERKLAIENRIAQVLQQEQIKWKQDVQELISIEREKWLLEMENEKNLWNQKHEQTVEDVERNFNKQSSILKEEYEKALETLRNENQESERKLQQKMEEELQKQKQTLEKESENKLIQQKAQLETELAPLQEKVVNLTEEVLVKTKQFYHQALLNMKLVMSDNNFDIPELIEQAVNENVNEADMNEWISKKLIFKK
ncbi:rho GTPase activating protein [Naegleria gruberi]|uniref:Rho GTPase activating protein n=1 Tax=Naegleria gruberi TaxID=5762 RepID=D2VUK4_NAEGR|nr:rho GTPase activating protein [Naegleria gruberi]EFC39526.1 rho GTPase activating protein [Naegleria gruberi]|eukprot:XP_002672270.1 rho GTPase activating protein [Naegleria gruberi strain NEG-M]